MLRRIIGLGGATLLSLSTSKAQNPAEPASVAAADIMSLIQTGDYPLAFRRGALRWRRAPFDPEMALAFTSILRIHGEKHRSQVVMEQALQMRPEPPAERKSRKTVAYGELLQASGMADAKDVLKQYFEPAKKADPEGPAAYLAIGRLALKHHDRELAAETFRAGLKRFPGDPEFALGLEKSGVSLPDTLHDPENGVASYLDLALRTNPEFTDALLHQAEKLAGNRDTAGARESLDQVLAINADHPEAWAYMAALALVEDDAAGAKIAAARARKFWEGNPRVSEIIGVTLAGQYRFEEAIVHLERAATEAPESAQILFELGSNQLRFGRLKKGWENVARAQRLDPYHVAAFNLITLRDKLRDYPVREKDGVLLRMSPEDMAVFGTRALDLAARAKRTLADKYQVKLSQPVMVEMLPKQEDFAIRTFGLPGGESFLGVCFGPLITMTSPRGRLGRANWEAVLWHEMAHTITLDASRHRIPRWLTEGISVYEEREVRAGWGQGMNSEFRERFLTDRFPPITRLDESFAGRDIMFGYYHSSLVVEFIMGEFGIEAMRSVLTDLATGTPVERALAAHTLPLDELESGFVAFAKTLAAAYGPDLDWTKLNDDEYLTYRGDPAAWVSANPTRYAAGMMWISKLSEDGKWNESKALLEKIIAGEPNNRETFNPYRSLALACRGLGDEAGERAALTKLLELDSGVSEASARLLEIGGSLPAADRAADADRMLETNPFQERAYRTLATTAKVTEDPVSARAAFLSLLALEPRDAGRVHYELATLVRPTDLPESRRHVLKALEENPRFEAALDFLITLPPAP